ncbi:adrenodoxin-like protein 2, mitochondrial [Sitodiplosis mosellana]|uniref:adrenodoxin-like protein 2, mitochondrial n=1 Tax=Sitodiplosis mosellana TaxID=263140 RepID=UPI0024452E47|nr:adrenodoxin-like protein 2, mitochondrial [Sitodiplosis mosellana]
MLRNTFFIAAHTLARPHSIRTCGEIAFRKVINAVPAISEMPSFRAMGHAKSFSTNVPNLQKDEIEVFFVKADGTKVRGTGKIGDSLLDVVVNNSIDLEGFGACEGTLTCSTCHLIFKQDDYDRLPEKPGDEELDMLDLAYELTDTSRLGCQIILSKELNGLEVRVPTTINDARS